MKKDLSAPGLLRTVRKRLSKIRDTARNPSISLADCLMSGLAIFGLKYSSLLQFDQERNKDIIVNNLGALYGVEKAPCDTYLRERLDEVLPELLRDAYEGVFAKLQRGKVLEDFVYDENH